MIRLLLFSLFVFAGICTKAQVYVDGSNLNADSTVQYVEIVHEAEPGLFSIANVDIGQKKPGRSKITDANGKKMNFNSPMHLLNYMKQHGWTMVRRDVIFQARRDAVGG